LTKIWTGGNRDLRPCSIIRNALAPIPQEAS
jgi:hypothetical protein